jgi:hypothetical protein
VIEPADGEAKHQCGSGIEPLHIVHGNDDRAVGREPPEHREHGKSDALWIRLLGALFVQ